MATRSVRVDMIARIEGESGLDLQVRDGRVTSAKLTIFEPPRLFEALLRGRGFAEVPDITARICGICPIAYQMSSVQAMENAFGVTVGGQLRALRRLIYCGEWIESLTLHVYLLHAPDFLGYTGFVEMARDHPELAEQGLALEKAGNAIVTVVGGREIHPVNLRVGGFYRTPARVQLRRALLDQLERARELALATVRFTAGLSFPEVDWEPELMALREPGRYPIDLGRIITDAGLDIAPAQFAAHVVEEHVEHSNALHARLIERGTYLTGPMARFNTSLSELSPVARDLDMASS